MIRYILFTPTNVEVIEAQLIAEENELYSSAHKKHESDKDNSYLQFELMCGAEPRILKTTLEKIYSKEGIEGTFALKIIQAL